MGVYTKAGGCHTNPGNMSPSLGSLILESRDINPLICAQMLKQHAGIALFRDLTTDQLALLNPIFKWIDFPADTIIFEQGQLPVNLYVIVRGIVAIRFKPYDGPVITITRLKRGDVFGWSAVIGSRFYTSGAIADSSVEAFRVRGEDLWTLVRDHPDTGKTILDRLANVVSSRWKNSHEQVQALFDEGMKKSAAREVPYGRQIH